MHQPVRMQSIKSEKLSDTVQTEDGRIHTIPLFAKVEVTEYFAVCDCGYKTPLRNTEDAAMSELETHRVSMASIDDLRDKAMQARRDLERLKNIPEKPQKARKFSLEDD